MTIKGKDRELLNDAWGQIETLIIENERLKFSLEFNVAENMKLIKQIGEKAVKEDATAAMLDDIISWEKDLSEYKSLEGILREKYKITKR